MPNPLKETRRWQGRQAHTHCTCTWSLRRPSWVFMGFRHAIRDMLFWGFYLPAWHSGRFCSSNIEVCLSVDITLDNTTLDDSRQSFVMLLSILISFCVCCTLYISLSLSLSLRRKLVLFGWCCRDVQNINTNLRSCQPLICQAQTSQLVENMAFLR